MRGRGAGGAPTPNHGPPRLLRREDEVRELRLVAEHVDRERLVLLPERPELVPDGPVHDRGDDDGHAVLPGPPEEGFPASVPSAELPEELLRRERALPGGPHTV